MKKQLLGIVIFCTTFIAGLLLSPMRFDGIAMSHGATIDGGFYGAYSYRSTYLVFLTYEVERYSTKESANEMLQNRISRQDVLEQSQNRVVAYIETKTGFKGYCIYRLQNTSLLSICSTSLWHDQEFERQEYKMITF